MNAEAHGVVVCGWGDIEGMGKRGRRRVGSKPEGPVWQTARVRCDDETWAQWRRVLGERSVAEALGAYVAGEVLKVERRRASQADLDDQEVREMLERVEDAQATLTDLSRSLKYRIQPRRPER